MFKVPDPIEVTFNFSKYVGLDPASTLYPQKYQEYQAHPFVKAYSCYIKLFACPIFSSYVGSGPASTVHPYPEI